MCLKHSSGDLKRLSFLVWSFGFFLGMRMSDQEMGLLDAAALQRGASNDLVWFEADLCRALEKADVAQTPSKGANLGSHPTFEVLIPIPHILNDLY
jgi:hypothetical protein